jgi:hypothetical protein
VRDAKNKYKQTSNTCEARKKKKKKQMERGEREMIKLQFPSLQVKYDSLALTSLLLGRKGSFKNRCNREASAGRICNNAKV